MKSYRTLALKELLSQKVTSILILIAVVLSTMMTTIVGQSIGVLSAMREQQAIAIGGNRYATFLQMNADQLHALEQDERLSYVGKSIYIWYQYSYENDLREFSFCILLVYSCCIF